MPIQRTETIPGYPIFEINHPAVSARVALHGAHLMEWTPAGRAPGLYLSPETLFQPGKAIRGGVPVCWPWFGQAPGDASLPMHGFARTRLWEPGAFHEHAAGVTLKFTLTDDESTRPLWPHPFHLELTMELGAGLHLALCMTNPGPETCTITSALHTYLTVGDIHAVHLTGLEGVDYLDTVGGLTERHQDGVVVFDREVDRCYRTANEITVHDPALARELVITGGGSHSAVVWNPWIAKSKTLTDLPDGAYLKFLCVETTNARQDSITLAPGASHVLSTTVAIRDGQAG